MKSPDRWETAMATPREKFATQVDTTLLASVRSLAQQEGRQLQALVEEALSDLIEKRKNARARAHVMAAYQGSHEKYGKLYQKLAK
jgi:Flp pilus assembly protein TadB